MHRELNHDFFKKWSSEMAYVLGYFAADGSMIRNKRGGHFIEFTSIDKEILSRLKHVTESSHRLSVRHKGGGRWKAQYRLQIGSKQWFKDLSQLGFTQAKSKIIRLPSIPRRYFGHFVRGYFDGDGGAYLGRYWSKWHKKRVWVFTSRFTSGSRIFLEGLHKELRIRGLSGGYLTKKNRGFELVFSRHDSLALYRLMYHTDPVSPLYLSRKRRRFERAIQVLKLNTMRL